MKDFLTFRRMVIPYLIQALFWIGVAAVVVVGLVVLAQGNVQNGLLLIILGPIGVRFYAEMLIVVFRINDTLTDIKNNTEPR